MKNISILLLAVLIFTISCSKDDENKADIMTKNVYSLEQLLDDNFEYTSGEVTVEGLCVHVCSHSGKKMFITGDNPDNKLQIFSSNSISSFNKELEGSKVLVSGELEEEKIDMNYINQWETELAAEADEVGEHACEFEANMNKIEALKEKIAKSKKGYISKYTMNISSLKEL